MKNTSAGEKLRRIEFLGREFLTWLLTSSAQNDNVFRLKDGRVVEVFFEKAITLEGEDPAKEMTTLRLEDPTLSEEVLTALSLGKKVSKARVRVVFEGREFTASLDSALTLRALRLPEVSSADAVEALGERNTLTNEVEGLVQSLFLTFLETRLDQERWSKEIDAITAWISGQGG